MQIYAISYLRTMSWHGDQLTRVIVIFKKDKPYQSAL